MDDKIGGIGPATSPVEDYDSKHGKYKEAPQRNVEEAGPYPTLPRGTDPSPFKVGSTGR